MATVVSPAQDHAVLEIRHQLEAARQAALTDYQDTRQAQSLLQALCRHTDTALQSLLHIHPLPEGATLAAAGGYGRGELFPYSDVDLLVLLKTSPTPQETQQLERLVAALWDLGIEPGWSVRTLEEALAYAREDITIETSLLEIRYIAGDRAHLTAFEKALRAQLDVRAFFRAKLTEMQQRHARYHNTPYALEPNCKESPGGLRDLQLICWLARAANFGSDWQEIAASGMITAQEARDLRRAERAFTRLRVELHLLTGRREDRLVFDLQQRLAEAYGIQASATRRASEILMQRYYWAARLVTQLNTILVESLRDHLFPVPSEAARPINAQFLDLQGRLEIAHDDVFEEDPSRILRAFLILQQNPSMTGMTARTLRALWHARSHIDASFRDDARNQALFLAILQQPHGIMRALTRMTMLNVLPRYLPAFRRVVGQMQHDLFHAYTVDQHTLQVMRNLRRFTRPEYAQNYPLCATLMADFDAPWLLYVAALFHDIAKGRGGDHSILGAQEVRRFARTHNLSEEDTALVEFLVAKHLQMSHVAQKQDISNPATVETFARDVGTPRRLAALYLLTVADIRGTGPSIWNAWKGKLLETLYHQARQVLDDPSDHDHATTALQQRKQEATVQIAHQGLSQTAREDFWNTLDVAYFLRHDTPEIVWHTLELHDQVHAQAPVVRVQREPSGQSLQIMVYVQDRDDLFAHLCMYFWRQGLSVQDARIHTTHEGYALDTFVVLIDEARRASTEIQRLARHIETGLAEYLQHPSTSTARQLQQSEHRPSRLSRAFPIEPDVELQPESDGAHWRLAVVATDRPGLLAQLAQVFVHYKVGVVSAKALTLGERVEDVFILHAPHLKDERIQRQFEGALHESLRHNTQGVSA